MRRNILNACLLAVISLTALGMHIRDSRAESTPTAGQLVPQSFASVSTITKTGYNFGNDIKTSAPPGSDQSILRIGNVAIEGLDPKYKARFEKLSSDFNGQKRLVSEIYGLAATLQQLYVDDGLFLNRVIIPPQHVVHGGTLTLKVAEGFLSEIDYTGLAPDVRDRVARYFIPLMGKAGLKSDEFQRALLLAARTNGLKLKTNLRPGKEDLGVALTVTGDYDAISGQVSMDNALSKSLGTYQATVSTNINSPFHWGEQFYFTVGGAPFNGFISEKSPRRTFAAGITAPLWDDGLSANLEYTWSGTRSLRCGCLWATASQFKRLTAKLTYPIMLDQSGFLFARASFDDVDEVSTLTAFNLDKYHDHLNVIRVGLDYSTFLGGVEVSGSLEASQGISGLWSRGPAEALHGTPISQADASDRFTKLNAHVHLSRDYDTGLSWNISGRVQYTPTGSLMNSEKFVMGCSCDLTGADAGSWNGDNGWTLRGELQYDLSPYLQTNDLHLKPYVFAARGQVYVNDPTAAELPVDGATGFGIGMRGQWIPQMYPSNPIEFGLEAARNLSDHPETVPSQWRFNFSLKAKF